MSQNSEIWLGTTVALEEYSENLAKFEAATSADFEAFNALREDGEEQDFENPLMSLHENIAIIEISGSLTHIDNPIVRYFGMTPYSMIYNAFIEAQIDDRVEKIVAVFDTDGGTVKGLSSALEGVRIAARGKGVQAYVQGSMNSAGYWLGSASTSAMLSASIEVGSIGVVAIIKNVSEALKKEGVKVEVMRAGEDKARVNPYEQMTDEVKAQLQEELDKKHTQFIEDVAENLGYAPELVRTSFGSGKVYSAEEALGLGMINAVSTYNEFFDKVQASKTSSQKAGTYGNLPNNGVSASASVDGEASEINLISEGNDMKKALKEKIEAAAIEGVELPVEEQTAEAEATAEATAEAEATVEAGEEAAEATGEGALQAEAESGIVELATKFAGVVEELAQVKAELAQAKQSNEMNEALMEKFREVTAESVNRMQILTGGSAQDLKEVTASNLLEMHASLRAQVVKNFPAGQQAQEGVVDEKVEEAVQSFEQHAHLVTLKK